MRLNLYSTILLALTVFFQLPLSADEGIVQTKAFIYTTPDLHSQKVCLLYPGAILELRSKSDEFAIVSVATESFSITGYFPMAELTLLDTPSSPEDPPPTPENPAYFYKQDANLRVEPSPGSKVLAKCVQAGVVVHVKKLEEKYSLVEYATKRFVLRGWVHNRDLKSGLPPHLSGASAGSVYNDDLLEALFPAPEDNTTTIQRESQMKTNISVAASKNIVGSLYQGNIVLEDVQNVLRDKTRVPLLDMDIPLPDDYMGMHTQLEFFRRQENSTEKRVQIFDSTISISVAEALHIFPKGTLTIRGKIQKIRFYGKTIELTLENASIIDGKDENRLKHLLHDYGRVYYASAAKADRVSITEENLKKGTPPDFLAPLIGATKNLNSKITSLQSAFFDKPILKTISLEAKIKNVTRSIDGVDNYRIDLEDPDLSFYTDQDASHIRVGEKIKIKGDICIYRFRDFYTKKEPHKQSTQTSQSTRIIQGTTWEPPQK